MGYRSFAGLRNLPFPTRANFVACSETLLVLGETLGCRDIPAQGLTPPLHPRKELRPLTRFRFAFPWRWFYLTSGVPGDTASRPNRART